MPPSRTPDADWFADEVQPHARQLRSYLRGAFPAVRDVDDVVQESLLRVWRTHATAPIRSVRALLFVAARRLALNVLRKQQNAPFVPSGENAASRVLDEKPDAREAALIQERIDLLADALMTLPPRCREIVVMHKIHGSTQREVAGRLGLSERTVETHVRTGIARCHAHLAARRGEPHHDER